MSKYPENCTLLIDGILFHANEYGFLPALVTCFGKWEVPNKKVIAVNIYRQANHWAGAGGTYVNVGHMFIRFSEVRFMREVESHIGSGKVQVKCDATGSIRHLRCWRATRDIEGRDYHKDGCILLRARYFDDCFIVVGM